MFDLIEKKRVKWYYFKYLDYLIDFRVFSTAYDSDNTFFYCEIPQF